MAYRELTVYELAAMWLYHEEYAAQNLGAVNFYAHLGQYEKNTVARMVEDFRSKFQEECATPTTGTGVPTEGTG